MIRNIVSFILLVGTGGLLLTETLFRLDNPALSVPIGISGIFFISGIYYHIRGLKG
ncbi:hypothetical protein HYG86_10820 [Alkalicella caledoniensis]|uniref:Uncharacterized protein n=1 Tax=Alkalicella caledoniensis TaxID=2731377 RepID=A0A7G9W956_ALKCA|nr:hypothetical protein [Alkalicella caledoniensis]QNO15218.1 hypothetical protein HYG86_10820 [Alkalicella caledoniensis]